MQPVNIGIIGLGNVGAGTLTILTENAAHIEAKLGFPLRVAAVCSRGDREEASAGGAWLCLEDYELARGGESSQTSTWWSS